MTHFKKLSFCSGGNLKEKQKVTCFNNLISYKTHPKTRNLV